MMIKRCILPVVLVIVLGFSWYTCINGAVQNNTAYNEVIGEAQTSIKNGLYEQGIEFYKKSLTYKNSEDTYLKIKEVYDRFYSEEHTSFVRDSYIEDMEAASNAFPRFADFWVTTANLYIEELDYSSAFKTVKKGLNLGASSKALDDLNSKLLYMVKEEFKLYSSFKTALNGYITVNDGNVSTVLDGTGAPIRGSYKNIGLINDGGKGIYVNDIDTRLLDNKEITRARFEFNVEDAGYYSESSGWVPVKCDGAWKYLSMSGKTLGSSYEYAGSFYKHRAAIKENGSWSIIDDSGKKVSNTTYEDIKLDLYGCFIEGDIVLAKENGKYHIYDENMKKISDFECDDIDICIDNNLIAFQKNGKWGFVDTKGKVVVEPKYAKAKSFANNMAAVCNDTGSWGYINSDYKLVIDYKYLDAYYFNKNGTSIISMTENTYQIVHFLL